MWKVASSSPLVVTSARLRYQVSRGLSRHFSLLRPSSRSQVHLTSAAVKGFPSCHLTSRRNLNVISVPSSFQLQLVASSGRIVASVFCLVYLSLGTRLLGAPIIGMTVDQV